MNEKIVPYKIQFKRIFGNEVKLNELWEYPKFLLIYEIFSSLRWQKTTVVVRIESSTWPLRGCPNEYTFQNKFLIFRQISNFSKLPPLFFAVELVMQKIQTFCRRRLEIQLMWGVWKIFKWHFLMEFIQDLTL